MQKPAQEIASGLTCRQHLTSDGGAIIFTNTDNNNKKVTVDLTGSENVMIDEGEFLKWKEVLNLKPGKTD